MNTTDLSKVSSTNSNRNTLTFNEAWNEVFDRAISKDKLYSEVRAGRISHLKVGLKILFRRNVLESWFHEQEAINYSGKSNV
ncbi:helix-turn-helix domain-containing protein [Paenibacillus sp. UKAQ_18]|nr:helix-turn-helix domain-containing protein [Paenibacillus sp. UKAQ_18]